MWEGPKAVWVRRLHGLSPAERSRRARLFHKPPYSFLILINFLPAPAAEETVGCWIWKSEHFWFSCIFVTIIFAPNLFCFCVAVASAVWFERGVCSSCSSLDLALETRDFPHLWLFSCLVVNSLGIPLPLQEKCSLQKILICISCSSLLDSSCQTTTSCGLCSCLQLFGNSQWDSHLALWQRCPQQAIWQFSATSSSQCGIVVFQGNRCSNM